VEPYFNICLPRSIENTEEKYMPKAVYINPSHMFIMRAITSKKNADYHYAMYKKYLEQGNTLKANKHYDLSQHYYNAEKEFGEKSVLYSGRTWRYKNKSKASDE
jgi:hypothetical protein